MFAEMVANAGVILYFFKKIDRRGNRTNASPAQISEYQQKNNAPFANLLTFPDIGYGKMFCNVV
jgi:hypothetical protein